jgi:hypothetical protein
MKKAEADYNAVGAALADYQLQTVREYAAAENILPDDWPNNTVCCVVAVVLAVDNIVRRCANLGVSEKRALAQAAQERDMDYETLVRHRRAKSRPR